MLDEQRRRVVVEEYAAEAIALAHAQATALMPALLIAFTFAPLSIIN